MNKTFILIIGLMVTLPFINSAQNYSTIIDTGKVWSIKEESSGNPYPFFDTRCIKTGDDTLISNLNYAKTYYAKRTMYDTTLTEWKVYGFLREYNKRVYYRDTLGNEGKIYDFNLNLNDTIFVRNVRFIPYAGDSTKVVVTGIDSILLVDKYYKRFFLKSFNISDSFWIDDIWIEGIGSTMGLDNANYNLIGMAYTLLCFTRNDTLIYHNTNYTGCFYIPSDIDDNNSNKSIQIFPNPTKDSFVVELISNNNKIKAVEVYDILGKKMKSIENILNKKIEVHKLNFNTGLYICKVFFTDDTFVLEKIVIE